MIDQTMKKLILAALIALASVAAYAQTLNYPLLGQKPFAYAVTEPGLLLLTHAPCTLPGGSGFLAMTTTGYGRAYAPGCWTREGDEIYYYGAIPDRSGRWQIVSGGLIVFRADHFFMGNLLPEDAKPAFE
jgi:hypothetical protein